VKKAFIEYDFPVKEVSEQSAKEKSIRQGHISTLHIWWARRPLAASRASIYASLVPAPESEEERIERSKFIVELSKWSNSDNKNILNKAQQDILRANGGVPPKVLDPFSGGGTIPLEALRLGCEVFASDLNPVALTIEKATLQYPQQYGQTILRKNYFNDRPWMDDDEKQLSLNDDNVNPLVMDVKYWTKQIIERAKKELGELYPTDSKGEKSVGSIWARTIICNNPKCKAEIPLVRQTWLANSANRKIAYQLTTKGNQIGIRIKEGDKINFNPSIGTIIGGKAICPACNSGISPQEVKEQFWDGRTKLRVMINVNLQEKGRKQYTIGDYAQEEKVRLLLEELEKEFDEAGHSVIPDEFIHTPTNKEYQEGKALYNFTPVLLYNMTKWRDLFNDRQLLFLVVLSKILKATMKDLRLRMSEEYTKVINTYVSMIFDRIVDYNSTLCVWAVSGEFAAHTFGRQALPMTWDFVEINPLSGSTGSLQSALKWVVLVIKHASKIDNIAQVTQMSATNLEIPEGSLDAIFTDPPYYDNVPYADISDYFFVWLKRNLIFDPKLFSTPLTPKSEEITDTLSLLRGMPKEAAYKDSEIFIRDKLDFEKMLYTAFCEFNRILKPSGIINIVYAHKSLDAWETIVNAILESGFYLTGSWPLHTERGARLRAKNSAALASSIYMVCRKRNTTETAYYNEIKPAIERQIHEKLDQFWAEGIGGSDFFISAIGPAVEVFGKYSSVEKLSGEKVTVKELLEYVRQVVSEHALSRILKNTHLGGIDNNTRFYLIWRFTYGNAKVLFDEASKLARAIGFSLDANWEVSGIVKKTQEWITLKGPSDRRNDVTFQRRIAKHFPDIAQESLFDEDVITAELPSMIDIMHQCLIFWSRNDRLTIVKLLEGSGYRTNNHFWQVAQSISDVLPDGDKEKQLLQGFLYGKEGYQAGKIPQNDINDAEPSLFGEK
jgi:putative DNA methylase